MTQGFLSRLFAITSLYLCLLPGIATARDSSRANKQFLGIKHVDAAFGDVQDSTTTHVLAADGPTEFFQVTQPLPLPSSGGCVQVLMEYEFANSYGAPFVGKCLSITLQKTISTDQTTIETQLTIIHHPATSTPSSSTSLLRSVAGNMIAVASCTSATPRSGGPLQPNQPLKA